MITEARVQEREERICLKYIIVCISAFHKDKWLLWMCELANIIILQTHTSKRERSRIAHTHTRTQSLNTLQLQSHSHRDRSHFSFSLQHFNINQHNMLKILIKLNLFTNESPI